MNNFFFFVLTNPAIVLLFLSLFTIIFFHIFVSITKEKQVNSYINSSKSKYLVVDDEGWELFWGFSLSSRNSHQEILDTYYSRGYQLHSFTLRNNMIPNVPLIKSLCIFFIYLLTFGYVSYYTGSTFIFYKV